MFSQLNFRNVIHSWFSSDLSPFQSFARCHNLLMCRCWIESDLCPQNLALLYWLSGSSHIWHAFEYDQCPADLWRSIFELYLSFEHWFIWQLHLNIQLSSLTHQSCPQLLISFSNLALPSVLHLYLLSCSDPEPWGHPWLTPFFHTLVQHMENPVGQNSKTYIIYGCFYCHLLCNNPNLSHGGLSSVCCNSLLIGPPASAFALFGLFSTLQ